MTWLNSPEAKELKTEELRLMGLLAGIRGRLRVMQDEEIRKMRIVHPCCMSRANRHKAGCGNSKAVPTVSNGQRAKNAGEARRYRCDECAHETVSRQSRLDMTCPECGSIHVSYAEATE